MANDRSDDASVVQGHNSEPVAPAHGSAERTRAHEEQLRGTHGSPADDQSMRRFDPLGSFRPPGNEAAGNDHRDEELEGGEQHPAAKPDDRV